MLKIDVLKLKGISKYLIKDSNVFNGYEQILNESMEASINVNLRERKKLLAVYLFLYGKKNAKDIMKYLNYQDLEKYNVEISSIIKDVLFQEVDGNKELEGNIIIQDVVDKIINDYLLDEEEKAKITKEIDISGGINLCLSYEMTKPLIIIELQKYSYIEDIRTIMEKVVIEYKKLAKFEFINVSQIEKYEIFYYDNENKKNEKMEILYLLWLGLLNGKNR